MKVSEYLLQEARPIWVKYDSHPFVLGLRNGDLSRERFRYYILQDYIYLLDYARAFSIGLAKAKSLETARLFSGYVQALTGSEMDIHRGYMGRLDITQEELDACPTALGNISYTSYMLRVAYEEGEAETICAILACACSYEYIAKNMAAARPECLEDPFYGDWVKGYVSDSYCSENVILLDSLDKLTRGYSQEQIEHLKDIFLNCSRFELGFWDLSWNMEG